MVTAEASNNLFYYLYYLIFLPDQIFPFFKKSGFLFLIVFEIILAYLEKKNWEEAFFTILPQRKGAKLLHEATEVTVASPCKQQESGITQDELSERS